MDFSDKPHTFGRFAPGKRSPGNHSILNPRVDLVPLEKKRNVYPQRKPKDQRVSMARSVCLLGGGGITKGRFRPVCLAGKEMSTNAIRLLKCTLGGTLPTKGLGIRGFIVQFPAGTRNLSLLQSIRTSCGVHPGSCSVGIAVSRLGGKAAGA